MTDFMSSPFVQAAQATLDLEAGLMTALAKWIDSGMPQKDWPPDLKQWLAAELQARIAYDYCPEDTLGDWITRGNSPLHR